MWIEKKWQHIFSFYYYIISCYIIHFFIYVLSINFQLEIYVRPTRINQRLLSRFTRRKLQVQG